jgi:hypothetical protein
MLRCTTYEEQTLNRRHTISDDAPRVVSRDQKVPERCETTITGSPRPYRTAPMPLHTRRVEQHGQSRRFRRIREITCMSSAVTLEFSGAFSWLSSDPATSIFEAPAARAAGIYLWTVDTPDGYLIYYVGETGVAFRQRLHQHLSQQLAGMYHIYEPGLFAVGQKHALWRGMYGRDRESGLAAFVEYLPTLAPALVDFVRLMRFHLAPLTCHMRLRRRIEAALARHLSSQPGLVGSFQDMGIRYLPRRAGEEPIQVRCQSSVMLLGLPSHLEA